MNNPHLSAASRNAAIDAITARLDGGTIAFYDGSQPATPDTAITTQQLLATLQLDDPAFGPASAGSAALAGTPLSAVIDTSGTATWARWSSSIATAEFDCSVGTSNADLTIDSADLQSGATVRVTGFDLTLNA